MQSNIDAAHHGDADALPVPESGGLIHKLPRAVDLFHGESFEQPVEVLDETNNGVVRMLPEGDLSEPIIAGVADNPDQGRSRQGILRFPAFITRPPTSE